MSTLNARLTAASRYFAIEKGAAYVALKGETYLADSAFHSFVLTLTQDVEDWEDVIEGIDEEGERVRLNGWHFTFEPYEL